eukprot:403351574
MCELNLLQIQSFYVEQISAQDIGSQDFQDKFLYKNERHKMTLLQNLIDNQRNEGQTYLKIDILDSGTGIRIEDQVQIFDLFQKTKFSADNINQQGMGLGLTVSNLLCETLGGKMFLDWSSEGQGTKFQLFIPCKMNQSEMRVVTTNSENFQIKKSFSEVENFSSFNFIDDPEPPQQMKPEYNQEFSLLQFYKQSLDDKYQTPRILNTQNSQNISLNTQRIQEAQQYGNYLRIKQRFTYKPLK